MITDPNLLRIQKLYNANEREINMLYDMCDNDLGTLELVYFRSKLINYSFFLPDNVLSIIKLILGLVWVRHKETGQIGYINDAYKYVEDKDCYYYGVQWNSGKDCKFKLTFWQPRHKFELV